MSKSNDVDLIAYCGLYCGDCAGHSGEIASAARALLDAMKKYKFERSARGMFPDKFKDYEGLESMLEFMSQTKCVSTCRERERLCAIAQCCVDRGFRGCHECDDFRTCETLGELQGVHGDSCAVNLEAIRDLGPEAWVASGRRLWFGSDVDDVPSSE